MSKLVASGLASALALTLVVGTNTARSERNAPAPGAPATTMESPIVGVPAEALPSNGKCRIWYDEIPADRQAAQMDCEHAHWVAQRWGGHVIDSQRVQAVYVGRNDFTGVPAAALPRPGYCRAWIEGAALAQQPPESDCLQARRTAALEGGRVLFMPL